MMSGVEKRIGLLLHLVRLRILLLFVDVTLDLSEMYLVSNELTTIPYGGDWCRVLIEEVDLLEGESLGLGDAEEGEDDAAGTRRTPDEEDFRLEVGVSWAGVDKVGGSVADGEVPEPVGGRAEGDSLGTDVERVDLTDDDPGDGAPCGGEGGDVDADEGDKGLLAGLIFDGDGDTDDSDEVLADAHSDCTPDEKRTTTESLDCPHARDSHEDVDDVGGDGNEEGI